MKKYRLVLSQQIHRQGVFLATGASECVSTDSNPNTNQMSYAGSEGEVTEGTGVFSRIQNVRLKHVMHVLVTY